MASEGAGLMGRREIVSGLLAGLAGQTVMFIVVRLVLPALFDTRPPPAVLVQLILGLPIYGGAVAVQLLITVVALPAAFVLAARPLMRAVVPDMPWWVMGAVFGAVIGLAALATIAFGWVGGGEIQGFSYALPPGLMALMAYGLTVAGVLHWREHAE